MTNKEKEIFIGENFELFTDGQERNCQWLVVFRDGGDIMLGEDTAYETTRSYYSTDSNFAIADEPILNNGGGYQNRFDISFLFDASYTSAFGCKPLSNVSESYVFDWLSPVYDSEANSDIYHFNVNGEYDNLSYVEYKRPYGDFGDEYLGYIDDYSYEYFDTLSDAKDYVEAWFLNAQGTIWERYNAPLRTYIKCMKQSLQCCLTYC